MIVYLAMGILGGILADVALVVLGAMLMGPVLPRAIRNPLLESYARADARADARRSRAEAA